jgi:hypothetical protein
MMMQSTTGFNRSLAPVQNWKLREPLVSESAPTAGSASLGYGYGYDYYPSQPPVPSQGVSGSRLLAWGGGAVSLYHVGRGLLGNSPSGWLIAGLLVTGALCGNAMQNWLIAEDARGSGLGKATMWSAGAISAFRVGRPILGYSPAAWLIATLLVAGALTGQSIYNYLVSRR